jgi:hypothetical protein
LSKNTGAIKRTQNFAIFFSRLTSKTQKKNKTEKNFLFQEQQSLNDKVFPVFGEKKKRWMGVLLKVG